MSCIYRKYAIIVIALFLAQGPALGQQFDGRSSVGQPCLRGDGFGGVCTPLPLCLKKGGTVEGAGSVRLCPYSAVGGAVVCCRSSAPTVAARKCQEWESGGSSGILASDVTVPHIVGGEEAVPGQFPHIVSLLQQQRDGRVRHVCGGALVDPLYVVTAAHCVAGYENNFEVRVGAHDLSDPNEPGSSRLSVLQVIVHQGYQPPGRYHDIAILRLSDKVPITRTQRPVCLPYRAAPLRPGDALTVAGWGHQDGGSVSSRLRVATLGYVDQATCNARWDGRAGAVYPSGATNTLLCAAAPGRDACKGDSGGPLMRKEEGREVVTLLGVVSQGLGCAGEVPGTYTRVQAYLDWIVDTIWPAEP
ncbi:venom peptide isomerase heavy chain [Hyalella azteca]|uniref:limulus clotting factor C n=1 Tax=Hyalella azteca TaxID=294128 RepID=A0A8B7PID7_HYAAZ|nr:venom peptide isomerase heavy chain [Hyalella azteca]